MNQMNIAQKAAGAQIQDHSKGYDHTKKSIISSIAKIFTVNPLLIDSSIVLDGSDVELGECYPLKKEKTKEGTDKPCYITIKLPKEEPIQGVTISHIPSGLTPQSKKLKKDERLIAEGSFDPEMLPHQTFEAQKFDIEGQLKHLTCKSVRFEFVNNYGNEDYTCIYRLHVHSGNNDKYFEDSVKILNGYQKWKEALKVSDCFDYDQDENLSMHSEGI
ncbi:MAG: hypothetical protein EZS28_032352 [Streblomastix strix]|uniref:SUN domain-containing protein n=1 Tax=Streblomastix strix TaxID=222440 RepID=A0A5J4UQ54_9EUKA|nr:MAG: hypothetical protein EZS28_032352 [Streblomastix strix]